MGPPVLFQLVVCAPVGNLLGPDFAPPIGGAVVMMMVVGTIAMVVMMRAGGVGFPCSLLSVVVMVTGEVMV